MAIPAHLIEGIDRLAPLPATVHALIAALTSGRSSLADVARLIEFDQAVASTVLRLARSAFYAGSVPAADVRSAVIRLGTQRLLEMVMGHHLRSLLVAAPMYDLTEHDLWEHGAATSLAVRALIEQVPGASIPAIAPTAALVHDIGKLIMVRYMKADAAAIVRHAADRHITFVAAERELLGCDHAEVGAAVARKWSFPDEVTAAIEHHHEVPLPEAPPIVDAVVLGNFISKIIGVGLGAEGMNVGFDDRSGERLGVDLSRFANACMRTMVWFKELRKSEESMSAGSRQSGS